MSMQTSNVPGPSRLNGGFGMDWDGFGGLGMGTGGNSFGDDAAVPHSVLLPNTHNH